MYLPQAEGEANPEIMGTYGAPPTEDTIEQLLKGGNAEGGRYKTRIKTCKCSN
jgi:hypothetical protein